MLSRIAAGKVLPMSWPTITDQRRILLNTSLPSRLPRDLRSKLCSVWEGLKRQWCELRSAAPGRRFQERYERNRLARAHQSKARRFLQLVIGVWLIKAGIILCFLPGPGIPLIAVGAAVLAERSQRMARALDWMEMKGRNFRKSRPDRCKQ